MKILIIGGGGREHAIAVALKKSKTPTQLYCAPGNAGIAQIAECVPLSVMDFNGLYDLCKKEAVELVVVAPDNPLAEGLVDFLTKKGVRAFGPVKAAARLEASKSYAKQFMKKHCIPTAEYQVFDSFDSAADYVKTASHPLVIKADGLALGKGVIISENVAQSLSTLDDIMKEGCFGEAGARVVIEEYMRGKEISMLAFCDGKTIVPMVSSQDHKRAFDNDKGLNTGGMGAISPSPAYTDDIKAEFESKVMYPTLRGLQSEQIDFKGVLYFGLMLTEKGIKVLEYNARFGDPETQAVLPRLESDLLDIIEHIIDGRLDECNIEWSDKAAVCVVLTSGGYPVKYEKGLEISIGDIDGATVYHAGTALRNGKLVTAGGRVLGVTALGATLAKARDKAYAEAVKIKFDKMHYRRDIGAGL